MSFLRDVDGFSLRRVAVSPGYRSNRQYPDFATMTMSFCVYLYACECLYVCRFLLSIMAESASGPPRTSAATGSPMLVAQFEEESKGWRELW